MASHLTTPPCLCVFTPPPPVCLQHSRRGVPVEWMAPAQQRWVSSNPMNTMILFVPQQEAWVVERMGRFHRILEPVSPARDNFTVQPTINTHLEECDELRFLTKGKKKCGCSHLCRFISYCLSVSFFLTLPPYTCQVLGQLNNSLFNVAFVNIPSLTQWSQRLWSEFFKGFLTAGYPDCDYLYCRSTLQYLQP